MIDGKPAAELDYSGLHIVILYAMQGISYWEEVGRDPYELEGYEKSKRMRDLLKLVLLVAINADSKLNAFKAVQWKMLKELPSGVVIYASEWRWVKEEGVKVMDVIDAFAQAHKPIAKKYLFSGYGTRLQNIDSRIAGRVINRFTGQGIPILTVHDSFLIEFGHGLSLCRGMGDAFVKVLTTDLGLSKEVVARIKPTGYGAEIIKKITEKYRYSSTFEGSEFITDSDLEYDEQWEDHLYEEG
jgi:hypothetical protein